MGSYIQENLVKGEKIIYQGHRHWIVFALPLAWIIVSVLFFVEEGFVKNLVIFPLIIALLTGIGSTIDYFMSEIGITTRRVIVKVGFFSRQSLETALQNIASVQVQQTFLGRLLNYGTIVVNDVGFTQSPFSRIKDPFSFRKAALQQIDTKGPVVDAVEGEKSE